MKNADAKILQSMADIYTIANHLAQQLPPSRTPPHIHIPVPETHLSAKNADRQPNSKSRQESQVTMGKQATTWARQQCKTNKSMMRGSGLDLTEQPSNKHGCWHLCGQDHFGHPGPLIHTPAQSTQCQAKRVQRPSRTTQPPIDPSTLIIPSDEQSYPIPPLDSQWTELSPGRPWRHYPNLTSLRKPPENRKNAY